MGIFSGISGASVYVKGQCFEKRRWRGKSGYRHCRAVDSCEFLAFQYPFHLPLLPSRERLFPNYGPRVSLLCNEDNDSAWDHIPGLQIPVLGTLHQPVSLHFENGDCNTLVSPNLQPIDCGLCVEQWSGCLSFWIGFSLHFPKGQESAQPWIQSSCLWSCSFDLIPIKCFHPTNIGLNPDCCSLLECTFLEGSRRIRTNGDVKSKLRAGKSWAGQTNIRTALKSRLSWKQSKSEVSSRSPRMTEGLKIWGECVRGVEDDGLMGGQWRYMPEGEGRCSWLALFSILSHTDNLDPFKHPDTTNTHCLHWVYHFECPLLVRIMLPQALEATYPPLRSFKTTHRPPLAMVFAYEVLKAWHQILVRPGSPVPVLSSLSPPSSPWKWTMAVNFLCRVTFRDVLGSILLKSGNWKASQFLLHQDFIISFEVNFQIHQTSLCSNGSMKMHVKIKKERFFWLLPFCTLHALACMSCIC